VSGYLRDSQLRRQLEEKVKEATRTRQAAEDGVRTAQDLIDQAKRIDANVTEAEKALAEAGAALADKDFKVAAEKAAVAVERGTRIYRERARTIVDSSANLAKLAKSTGADLAEAEAALAKAEGALANDELGTAIDHAKKAWKRSEKVLQEHLSSSFSKVQALILSGKNLGRDVAHVEDLLSRARTAMENNDFQSATEFTKEGLETITDDLRSALEKEVREAEDLMRTAQELGAEATKSATLIERARGDVANLDFEKANNAVRQSRAESDKALQRSLDGKIADFTKFINDARALGVEPGSAQEHFAKAEAAIRKGDYREGAQLAKQGFQTLQQAQFQRVVGVIGTSREKFVAAVKLGIDLAGPFADLNVAREALKRNAFREALESARKAETEVDRILDRYRKVEVRLKDLHRAFAEAESFGVNANRARVQADKARKAYQNRDAAAVEQAIDAAFEELRKSERERVLESIERVEFILTLGEQNGVDLSEPSRLLEEGIIATKADEHRKALRLAMDAGAKADHILTDFAAGRVSAMRSAVPHLGDEGANLKSLINRADTALASRDFEGAFRAIGEGQRFVEARTRSEAEEIVEDLGLAIQLGMDTGVAIAAMEPIHRELKGFLAAGRMTEIVAARDRASTLLAGVTDALVASVRTRVATAQALKIDVDEMADLLRRGRMAFGVQNYHDGLKLLSESNERASQATALHRQAYNAIASAAAFVADAKKRNVDVSKVVEMLVDAKKAFERLEYERALQLASEARAETDKLTILYSSAQRILSSRSRLELAGRLGIDAPHLREIFTEAKEAMKSKDYGKALELAQRSEVEFTSLIKERIGANLASAQGGVGSVEGANLAAMSDEIVQARQFMDAGELDRAADLALHLREQLDTLKRQGDEATAAMARVRDVLGDAEAMSLAMPTTLSLLEKAERAHKMGRFEEALDHLAQAEAEATKERDQGIAQAMRRFEESLARAKREGTDVRSAERLYDRAREFFRNKKYRQALATAVQSEAEAERVALQQTLARQAVEAVERKLKVLGRPSMALTNLAREARRVFDEADYVKALDAAIRATDAIADFRILLEHTQEIRKRAEGLLTSARSLGADAGKFEALFNEGDAAVKIGDVERARGAFSGAIEWGVSGLRSSLQERLRESEGLVEMCRRLQVDPTSALNRFAEARTLLESEDFQAAHDRIEAGREAAQTALGGRLHKALAEAADNVAHAKKLGSDARDAEELLRQASEQTMRGQFESALEVVDRALERVESAKVVEKRFIDLSYKAETTIRNGRKFGIDMRAAEARLAEAVQLRRKDFAEAIKVAEEAYRLAWESTEAFAPSLTASLEVGPSRLNEWADATLTLENVGKGLAKDVRVRILGDAETDGLPEVPAVRAKGQEVVKLRIKMTASGSVPLAIQIVSHRVFDGKEYTQEMIAQIDVSEVGQEKAKRLVADLESRCPTCKGLIKKGFKVTRCGCGRDFHELCASRVGRCPVCFRSLGTAAA